MTVDITITNVVTKFAHWNTWKLIKLWPKFLFLALRFLYDRMDMSTVVLRFTIVDGITSLGNNPIKKISSRSCKWIKHLLHDENTTSHWNGILQVESSHFISKYNSSPTDKLQSHLRSTTLKSENTANIIWKVVWSPCTEM